MKNLLKLCGVIGVAALIPLAMGQTNSAAAKPKMKLTSFEESIFRLGAVMGATEQLKHINTSNGLVNPHFDVATAAWKELQRQIEGN